MAILVGIDEAGYGPLLGPLVVSSVVFEVPDADPPACLWEQLAAVVARTPSRRESRLIVADSKKLFAGRKSLAPLERVILVFEQLRDQGPARARDLLAAIAPKGFKQLGELPWYADLDFALPLDPATGHISTRCAALAGEFRRKGLHFRAARSVLMPEHVFNEWVGKVRKKSTIVLQAVLRHVNAAIRDAEGRAVFVLCDRLGGRANYRQPLMTAFPEFACQVLSESPELSEYALRRGRQVCRVGFRTEGETHAMVTALAGVYSKYVRELCMAAFNRYWNAQCPKLRPTAGYYADGQRFLRDLDPTLRAMGLTANQLARAL